MRIAIDFDRTMTTGEEPTVLRPEAVNAARLLLAAGHTLILHSVRLVPPHAAGYLDDREPDEGDEDAYAFRYLDMKRTLEAAHLWDHFVLWDRPGKPDADIFLDDRAWNVGRTPAAWARIVETFGPGTKGR